MRIAGAIAITIANATITVHTVYHAMLCHAIPGYTTQHDAIPLCTRLFSAMLDYTMHSPAASKGCFGKGSFHDDSDTEVEN